MKIINVFGKIQIEKLSYDVEGKEAIDALSDKNSLEVDQLTNALSYVQIFREAVPGLITLGDGFIRLMQKKTNLNFKILEKKRELEGGEVKSEDYSEKDSGEL